MSGDSAPGCDSGTGIPCRIHANVHLTEQAKSLERRGITTENNSGQVFARLVLLHSLCAGLPSGAAHNSGRRW